MTPTRTIVASIEGEYRRYKSLADDAIAQLDRDQLAARLAASDNSIATIVAHMTGNLRSRFTDLLSSDGEKPWRDRDAEFVPREVDGTELMDAWHDGWRILFDALAQLDDDDLTRAITIRDVPLPLLDALHRSLAHAAYHVGQIVYVAKSLRGDEWRHLSIPPGQSAAYRANPALERALNHERGKARP